MRTLDPNGDRLAIDGRAPRDFLTALIVDMVNMYRHKIRAASEFVPRKTQDTGRTFAPGRHHHNHRRVPGILFGTIPAVGFVLASGAAVAVA